MLHKSQLVFIKSLNDNKTIKISKDAKFVSDFKPLLAGPYAAQNMRNERIHLLKLVRDEVLRTNKEPRSR